MMSNSDNVVLLKQAGDGITIRVTACAPMKIGNFPEIQFIGVDSTGATREVRVPSKSADRQLERLGLSYDAAMGQTLTISRSPNASAPTKPFWDVELASAPIDAPQRVATTPTPVATAAPATNAAPPQQGSKVKKTGAALYLEITEFTLTRVKKLYEEHQVPVTMEGIAACVATQFISANH